MDKAVRSLLAVVMVLAAVLMLLMLIEIDMLGQRLGEAERRLVEMRLKLENKTLALKDAERRIEELEASKTGYERLLARLFSPLVERETPTLSELREWLRKDNTSEIWFDEPGFMCGDYAFTLVMRARLKNWDVGIVVIRGTRETGAPCLHAFNAVMCREGRVYIEPQTDEVFWFEGHRRIRRGDWLRTPDGYVRVEDYVEVLDYGGGG